MSIPSAARLVLCSDIINTVLYCTDIEWFISLIVSRNFLTPNILEFPELWEFLGETPFLYKHLSVSLWVCQSHICINLKSTLSISHICTQFCLYLTNIWPIYHLNQGHISVILIWEKYENQDLPPPLDFLSGHHFYMNIFLWVSQWVSESVSESHFCIENVRFSVPPPVRFSVPPLCVSLQRNTHREGG